MVHFIINELRKSKFNSNVEKICRINDNTTKDKRPDIALVAKVNN